MQRHKHAIGRIRPGILLGLLLVAASAASHAGMSAEIRPRGDPAPRMIVRYSAQDLRSASGQDTLYRKLQRAATRVCAIRGKATLQERAFELECMEQALARGVADVNAPAITAMHRAKTRPATTS